MKLRRQRNENYDALVSQNSLQQPALQELLTPTMDKSQVADKTKVDFRRQCSNKL